MQSEEENILQLVYSTDTSNHLIAYQILKGNKDLQQKICDKEFISNLINSSQESQIKIALLLIKRDSEISDWAKIRYAPLLDFLGINALNGIIAVPKKLLWVKKIASIEISLREWGSSDSFATYLAKLNIVHADFCSKSMKKLPDFLFKIPSLESLVIGPAKLKELPDCWEKLPKLTSIVIQQNQLKTLPKSFEKLKNIIYISLRNNHFTELPKVIQSFKILTILGLSRNKKMTSLPKWLGNFKHLRHLSLADSKIDTFPSSFVRLKLADLRLHNTPLAQKYNFERSTDPKIIKNFIAKVVRDKNEIK